MNKFGVFLLFVASCFSYSAAAGSPGSTCLNAPQNYFKSDKDEAIPFIDMKDQCVTATQKQIEKEVNASMGYLSLGAYFARDSVNRPGFSKFFFDAASEEREHATKLIEYLAMRGRYLNDESGEPTQVKGDVFASFQNLRSLIQGAQDVVKDFGKFEKGAGGLDALKKALSMEVDVTKSIRDLIEKCEKDEVNDYHFVDYLTGEFLEEQYKGQRDLAGKISTLGKMIDSNGAELGEFLFDKSL